MNNLKTKKTVIKKQPKTFIGHVVSDKMSNTIVVLVHHKYRHPLYHKIVNKKHKLYASNNLKAGIGDQVLLAETKPISKLVRFVTTKIIKKA